MGIVKSVSLWTKCEKPPFSIGCYKEHKVIEGDIQTIDMYCFLKAKFGSCNSTIYFMPKLFGDNPPKSTWGYVLTDGDNIFEIFGERKRFKIFSKYKISESEWEKIIVEFKDEFSKFARQKSEVYKSLEKSTVVLNIYYSYKQISSELLDRSNNFECNYLKNKDIKGIKDSNAFFETHTELIRLSFELQNITMLLLESFVNLVFYTYFNSIDNNDDIKDKLKQPLKTKFDSCMAEIFQNKEEKDYINYKAINKVISKRSDIMHANYDFNNVLLHTFENDAVELETKSGNMFGVIVNISKMHTFEEKLYDLQSVVNMTEYSILKMSDEFQFIFDSGYLKCNVSTGSVSGFNSEYIFQDLKSPF